MFDISCPGAAGSILLVEIALFCLSRKRPALYIPIVKTQRKLVFI